MPKDKSIKKVLVIGSGPIVIGQAAEFDYAGTQACMALQEEGCKVVLVNNNPATIMTDEQFAQTVYFEPLTIESLTNIIKKEKPDAILGTLGGQTGLNLTVDLYQKGILDQFNVKVLGTAPESIIQGEDREEFRSLMHQLNEPVPVSEIIHTVDEALSFTEKNGYPVIIRPAYTLGGGGGGIAADQTEMLRVVKAGLESSPITQCLIEKSIAGYKEIEFEMIRDENDTCIAICSMENFDPVGVHTGDSIVIAPQQTLTDEQFDGLYQSAVKIIRALKIVGGCNIQFAQEPDTNQYYLIEVNPRLSRSSALASKATGYPIARIAAKLSLGFHLHEILNPVTGSTYASFEPVVDYTVVKMPRWAFDKFPQAERKLGTQMKATGEIMAIDRFLPSAIQKAIRSLELKVNGLSLKGIQEESNESLWESLTSADDKRLFSILELLRRGVSIKDVHDQTAITMYFLESLQVLVSLEQEAIQAKTDGRHAHLLLKKLKENGFTDSWIAAQWGMSSQELRTMRKEKGIHPGYLMVDSCAGEFPAQAPYYYSTWKSEGDPSFQEGKKKIAIIGSGPVRIGQGIEFDYCTVRAALFLKESGYETIMINNNPGTVSTDFQIADRLYFEPLHHDDVLDILEYEQPDGVIVQLGGQTAINLADELEKNSVPLLAITQEQIDLVEDRDRFYQLLKEQDIPHIPGVTAANEADLRNQAAEIGYPMLLRPSYVIGGQGMIIVDSEAKLEARMPDITFPVLMDAYYEGTELEIDVLSDGNDIYIPAYFEHIEKAGVHSGDSMTITPPISIGKDVKKTLHNHAKKIAKALEFKGLFNVQFVLYEGTVYMLEVNPRASRTVPIVSKITGVNLIDECINILTGSDLPALQGGEQTFYTIKNPVFSTGKLEGVDPKLTPEMKSTGELMALGSTKEEALAKAFFWNESLAGKKDQKPLEIFMDVPSHTESLVEDLIEGMDIHVTASDDFADWLKESNGSILLSLSDSDEAAKKREAASAAQVTVITQMDTFDAYLTALKQEITEPKSLQEWLKKNKKDVGDFMTATDISLKGKDFLTLADFSKEEIVKIIKDAIKLKEMKNSGESHEYLKGKTLAMIFEKSSTRTRVSFEVGMNQLGGSALFLGRNDIQMGRGETVQDTAKVLSRYVDGIMIRAYDHQSVEELAKNATVPVINGLTDDYHPCQVLADLMTLYEAKGAFEGKKLAYIGDGNNMTHSLMIGCAKLGVSCSVAAPEGYEPKKEIVEKAQQFAAETGAVIEITTNPAKAAEGADAVYTDVWTSMGWEDEQEVRLKAFSSFQVNQELMNHAKKDAIFLHCLPAHRGEEVSAEVIDGPQSLVFDEAENRLHAQKALMAAVMGEA